MGTSVQARKRKQCKAPDTKEYGEPSEGPHAERVSAAQKATLPQIDHIALQPGLEADVRIECGSATVARRAKDQAATVLNERILTLLGFLSWERGIGVLPSDTRPV